MHTTRLCNSLHHVRTYAKIGKSNKKLFGACKTNDLNMILHCRLPMTASKVNPTSFSKAFLGAG